MAHIGIGSAKGDEKAIEAVKLAVASPLLETTINGASHVIINISGDISLMDANDAASYVQDLAGDDANIIFGAKFDETMTDEATITVIATGLEEAGAVPSGMMAGAASAATRVQSRMVYPNQTATTTARPTSTVRPTQSTVSSTARPMGVTPTQATPNTTASQFNGIQRPRQPETSVKPVEINIPDFLKNSKR